MAKECPPYPPSRSRHNAITQSSWSDTECLRAVWDGPFLQLLYVLCSCTVQRERQCVSYKKLILLCLAELPVFRILLLVCRGFLQRTKQTFHSEHGLRNVRGSAKSPIKHKHGDSQDSTNKLHRRSALQTLRPRITAAT